MEQPEGLGGELVELASEPLLAKRADVPGLRGLLLLGDREDEAAELRMLGPDASSRLALRRSNSRRAEAPAVPPSRTSMKAGSPGGRVVCHASDGSSWPGRRSPRSWEEDFNPQTRHLPA